MQDRRLGRSNRSSVFGRFGERRSGRPGSVSTYCEAMLRYAAPQRRVQGIQPATCTLPPDYTEPGIKLVGTMAVLHGEAVYDRMRRANHCVMVAVAVDTAENIQAAARAACSRTRRISPHSMRACKPWADALKKSSPRR